MIFVSDSPTQHKRISQIEKDYILESLKNVALSADKSHQDKVWVLLWQLKEYLCFVVSKLKIT